MDLTPTNRFSFELRQLQNEHHDSCTACGYVFNEADTAHLGYTSIGAPAYVCGKCSTGLGELASRQYFMKRPFEVPHENAVIWRYMDFTKFVSLLSSNALYFSRADQFDDIYEGAKGLKTNKAKWDSHYLEFFRSAIRNPPDGYEQTLDDGQIEEQAQRLVRDLETGGQHSRTHTFINCWHENEHESEAMWRLYSVFLPNALVLRSTYGRLYRSLGRDPSIRIGRVQYLDMTTTYAGVNDAFWRKRKSFEHEREIRTLIARFNASGVGTLVPCDLSELIVEIVLSPKAPAWFASLVSDVSAKYGISAPVIGSRLNDEPFY